MAATYATASGFADASNWQRDGLNRTFERVALMRE
jgi:hypothetical protein